MPKATPSSIVDGTYFSNLAGIPAGAGIIPAANLPSAADNVIWIPPQVFYPSGATKADYNANGITIPTIEFANGVLQTIEALMKIPTGATSIAAVYLDFLFTAAGNVYMKFNLGHIDTDANAVQEVDTSDAYATYASPGTGAIFGAITVPAGAYNELTGIEAHDLISLKVFRDATNASDTMETGLRCLGARIQFA